MTFLCEQISASKHVRNFSACVDALLVIEALHHLSLFLSHPGQCEHSPMNCPGLKPKTFLFKFESLSQLHEHSFPYFIFLDLFCFSFTSVPSSTKHEITYHNQTLSIQDCKKLGQGYLNWQSNLGPSTGMQLLK